MDIKGHAAIVTGGGSGLGAATAAMLAAAGAKVALLDVNMDAANAHAKTIGGIAVKCDVSDAASAEAAVKEANAKLGTARILLNCAGVGTPKRIVGRDGPMPLGDYEKVIKINLIGTFNVLRLFAADCSKTEPLEEGERGVIINTASVAAQDGQIGQAAYSASKAGVLGMALPIARDLMNDGIRVNTILPGVFKTPMVGMMPQNVQDALAAQVPFPKRLGQPEEYARLALFIAENPYLNGEAIRLDGAIRMAPR
jgi:NAD(P)-dependent dehydrogenase (short-subunit alcohol dehydrogenase family)